MKIRINNKYNHREQIPKLIRELLRRTFKTIKNPIKFHFKAWLLSARLKNPGLDVNNIIWVNPKRIVYGSLDSKPYGSSARTCLHQTQKRVEAISSILEVPFEIPSVGYNVSYTLTSANPLW